MKRFWAAGIVMIFGTGAALAQNAEEPAQPTAAVDAAGRQGRGPQVPIPADERINERAVSSANTLIDPWRARYILRQLDIPAERMTEFEPLLKTVSGSKIPPGLVAQVMAIGAELDVAQDEGNEPRVEQLKEQMAALMQQPFQDFISSIRSKLSPEESTVLDGVIARLEDNPSGALRPSDLLSIARSLDLTDEQRQRLLDLKMDFRMQLTKRGPRFDTNLSEKANMISRIAIAVRGVLTPEQAAAFNRRVELMRTDLMPGIGEMDAVAAEQRLSEPRRRPGPRSRP